MVFGNALVAPGPRNVVAVVGNREIRQTEDLLHQLATNIKGRPLTFFERRRVNRFAPSVAMRRKRGISPSLTQDQAMAIRQIVGR